MLKDLDRLLIKYKSLKTKSRRIFNKIGFETYNTNEIRLRLILNILILNTFNNAYI